MVKLILNVSIIIFIISSLILLILINNIKPPLLKINDISDNKIYNSIKINAKVTLIKNYGNFMIIEVKDKTGKINVLVEEPEINISKNQELLITGKITEYKGKLEIKAEKIEVLI